jgi:hypothetical protein
MPGRNSGIKEKRQEEMCAKSIRKYEWDNRLKRMADE